MSRASTIREIKSEIEKMKAQKADIDGRLESLEGALRHFESLPTDLETVAKSEGITDAIHAILSAERPLHRKVIYERIRSRGIVVGGSTPINSTGAYLSRDSRFKSLGKGMWTLAEPIKRPDMTPTGNGVAQMAAQGRRTVVFDGVVQERIPGKPGFFQLKSRIEESDAAKPSARELIRRGLDEESKPKSMSNG